ncbi:unnamed protein product, partial [Tetraodon nigroviridis]
AEMSEVVIVTIPESVDGLSSVEEQEKAVLVSAELNPQEGGDIITVAPQDGIADVGETNLLSKEEAVIGNAASCFFLHTAVFVVFLMLTYTKGAESVSHQNTIKRKCFHLLPTFHNIGCLQILLIVLHIRFMHVFVVAVKITEEVDAQADVFYPITCGDAKATLIWKKFVCPGINVKCVQVYAATRQLESFPALLAFYCERLRLFPNQFNDQLISPKEFVCLAGKSTLKDWKRAIRLNSTMLRKIMDSGELDFYQHSKVCSNTCRSTKIDLVGAKVSSEQSMERVSASPAASG